MDIWLDLGRGGVHEEKEPQYWSGVRLRRQGGDLGLDLCRIWEWI